MKGSTTMERCAGSAGAAFEATGAGAIVVTSAARLATVGHHQRFVKRGPGPQPQPARPSIARRTTERSVRAASAAAHVLKPVGMRDALRSRPTLQKHSKRAPQVQIVLAREAGKLE